MKKVVNVEPGEVFKMLAEGKDLYEMKSERKTGKWIDYTDDGYVECSFCRGQQKRR